MKCKCCTQEIEEGYCKFCYSMNNMQVDRRLNMEVELMKIKNGILKILEKHGISEEDIELF